MNSPRHAILICEDGWEGIREFARTLSKKGIPTSIIIKGNPALQVRQMISPLPKISNFFIERRWYRLVLFPILMALLIKHRWNFCCVTKERTHRQLQSLQPLLRFDLYLFDENGRNSRLISLSGEKINPYLS